MSMNYDERCEMRQLEVRIERLEKELNDIKARITAKRRGEEKAVAEPLEGAETR